MFYMINKYNIGFYSHINTDHCTQRTSNTVNGSSTVLAFCLYGLLFYVFMKFLKLKKNWMQVTFNGRTEIFQVSIKKYISLYFQRFGMT